MVRILARACNSAIPAPLEQGPVPPLQPMLIRRWTCAAQSAPRAEDEEITSQLTETRARYRTSGFSCVISSITRVFAPRLLTRLHAKASVGHRLRVDKKEKRTHDRPRSQCLTYCPTSTQATASTVGSAASFNRVTSDLQQRARQ